MTAKVLPFFSIENQKIKFLKQNFSQITLLRQRFAILHSDSHENNQKFVSQRHFSNHYTFENNSDERR